MGVVSGSKREGQYQAAMRNPEHGGQAGKPIFKKRIKQKNEMDEGKVFRVLSGARNKKRVIVGVLL